MNRFFLPGLLVFFASHIYTGQDESITIDGLQEVSLHPESYDYLYTLLHFEYLDSNEAELVKEQVKQLSPEAYQIISKKIATSHKPEKHARQNIVKLITFLNKELIAEKEAAEEEACKQKSKKQLFQCTTISGLVGIALAITLCLLG